MSAFSYAIFYIYIYMYVWDINDKMNTLYLYIYLINYFWLPLHHLLLLIYNYLTYPSSISQHPLLKPQ